MQRNGRGSDEEEGVEGRVYNLQYPQHHLDGGDDPDDEDAGAFGGQG